MLFIFASRHHNQRSLQNTHTNSTDNAYIFFRCPSTLRRQWRKYWRFFFLRYHFSSLYLPDCLHSSRSHTTHAHKILLGAEQSSPHGCGSMCECVYVYICIIYNMDILFFLQSARTHTLSNSTLKYLFRLLHHIIIVIARNHHHHYNSRNQIVEDKPPHQHARHNDEEESVKFEMKRVPLPRRS